MIGIGLEVSGLTKVYNGRPVVREATFQVPAGSVTGLLGPNGSGKTTVLRITLGLERPTSGSALLGGRRYSELRAPYRAVGALLDASWVHPGRTARSQLQWICQATGLPIDNVERALDEVGLTGVADRKVGTFSLGMRQRLGIATTTLGDPAFLIYDEPLNGLDPTGVELVREFFFRQAAAGRAVLVSSHQLAEVALSADRIVVLGRGEVVHEGPVDAPGDDTVEVEVADDDVAIGRLIEDARAHGWQVSRGVSGRGAVLLRIGGTTVPEITARVMAAGGELRRVERRSSLEQTYRRLTDDRVEFGAAGGTGDSGR